MCEDVHRNTFYNNPKKKIGKFLLTMKWINKKYGIFIYVNDIQE